MSPSSLASEGACVYEIRNCLQELRKTHVAKHSYVLWPWNVAQKIRLALLSGLMCVSNVLVSFVSFLLWSHFIGMRAVIKAHKTADSKIDAKACLHKHMVTKQSLLL